MNRKYFGFEAWLIVVAILGGFLFLKPAPCLGGGLEGSFTITEVADSVNGQPSTGVFDHLVGLPLTISLSFFQIRVSRYSPHPDVYVLEMQTPTFFLNIEGDSTSYLQDVVEPSLHGSDLDLKLINDVSTNTTTLEAIMVSPGSHQELFAFLLSRSSIVVPLDENHYPELMDYELLSWPISLERIDPETLKTTDIGNGPGEFHFSIINSTVETQHVTLGQLKVHFQKPVGHS